MDKGQENKELGLIDIMQIMGQWGVALVKTLTDWFLYLFFFGVKRWKIFVVVGLVAGIYSFVTYKIQADQYEANMIVRSNAVESIPMKNFFDAYSNVLENDLLGASIIEERTGLDSVQRSLLTSVSVFYCVDEDKDGVVDVVDRTGRFSSSDASIDSLNLCINVRFEDVSILPELVTSMVHYVETNPYVLSRNKSRLLELQKRRDFLVGEIDLLDTLQKRTYEGSDIASTLQARGSHVLVDNRKVLVYEDKLILLDLLEVIQQDLEIYSTPITVVEDFVIEKSAINRLSTIVKKNVILALVSVYFILFIFFLYNKEKDKYLN